MRACPSFGCYTPEILALRTMFPRLWWVELCVRASDGYWKPDLEVRIGKSYVLMRKMKKSICTAREGSSRWTGLPRSLGFGLLEELTDTGQVFRCAEVLVPPATFRSQNSSSLLFFMPMVKNLWEIQRDTCTLNQYPGVLVFIDANSSCMQVRSRKCPLKK